MDYFLTKQGLTPEDKIRDTLYIILIVYKTDQQKESRIRKTTFLF